MREQVAHTLAPIYQQDSKLLILGTMPSPKSREKGFYYSHPQNKFWKVLADVFQEEMPQSNEEKEQFLLKHHIALWDVLKSCEIKGAADDTIKNPIPNDLTELLNNSEIHAIYTTGGKAAQLYKKYLLPQTKIEAIGLPSTSPANCRFYSYDDLVESYRTILNDLG